MEPGPDTAPPPVRAATWVGFGAMCVGMFMAILDVQIVATSLPTIRSALGIRADQMSWVQTAYLIAEVIAIPLTGLLTRTLGMRRLFVLAVAGFTAASAGCAASDTFAGLVAWRVVQGFAGGMLIPLVFSAVFLLFPERRQGLATTIAGVLAVLAPTTGPVAGGWITSTYSWHWLFLVNVPPGLAVAAIAVHLLPREPLRPERARGLDVVALGLLAISLASLQIGLKEAPDRGWASAAVFGLIALSAAAAWGFATRVLRSEAPIVALRSFSDRRFAVGCLLSFVLGIGLFGSVYLMPVFLAAVRGHDALGIGTIMLVTGAAQLAMAPVAVALERRVGARLLTGAGFAVFALGLGLSSFQTPRTDFDGMFWPQVIRGLAIMFCLLPPTRLALGHLAPERVPDASGLFNLMRNLGGAIGLALIDTVVYGRAPHHAAEIVTRLRAGDADMARFVGIPPGLLAGASERTPDAGALALLDPLVGKAAATMAINEAWLLIALLTAAATLCVPFMRAPAAR